MMFLGAMATAPQARADDRGFLALFDFGQEERYAPPVEDQRLVSQVPDTTRELVSDPTHARPGTVTIITAERVLYLSLPGGQAYRYRVGVGRPGFTWHGVRQIGRKEEWPNWRPPSAMLKRRPDLPHYMTGGVENPLGARAMYLYEGENDFRLPHSWLERARYDRSGGLQRLHPHAERRRHRSLQAGEDRRDGQRALKSVGSTL